jgi:hypothetical protein
MKRGRKLLSFFSTTKNWGGQEKNCFTQNKIQLQSVMILSVLVFILVPRSSSFQLLLPSSAIHLSFAVQSYDPTHFDLHDVQVGDLVTFSLQVDDALRVGFTEALGVVLEDETVQPLCSGKERSREFVWDEELGPVEKSRVVRCLDMAGVFLEQRKAPRSIDPHGEHSEDAFIISRPLEPFIYVPVRPHREANW